MQAQVVLIIDSRNELSQKYKKIIQQDCYVYPVVSHDLQQAFEIMEELEPDLVIVSDTFEEKITDLCEKIRNNSRLYRPVLVVLSKSSYLEDKLNALKSGADDFISEPIESSEFSIRIFAHLRRHVEELSNAITQFPNEKITYKVLKRLVNSDIKWSLLYLDIDHFKTYSEIYGYLAADKVLKTFAAILRSSIDKGDFIGHLGENVFVIMTSPYKAEQMAVYLNYTFDAVAPKFYSEKDAQRGYLIISSDEKAGIRIPLVSTSIGIVSNQYKTYNNYQEAINAVINVHKLIKFLPGSSWISDRPKISTEEERKIEIIRNKIMVVESDAALAYLLDTTLEMQGYKVEVTGNIDELVNLIEENQPDLLLLDSGDADAEKCLEICSFIKNNEKYSSIKIIVSTVTHEKELVLDAGADLYLPKPYELMTLFGWIHKILNYE
ncbi:MAG: response regulator [Candidatus Gastranaerophilales bacterium]|nr:response regulator [Candidatus Gastranaerophilales bacterium]